MSKGRKVPPSSETPVDVPAYVDQVLRAAGLDAQPGGVTHVEIRHDSWCDLLNGRGPCNCTPTTHAGAAINRKYSGKPAKKKKRKK